MSKWIESAIENDFAEQTEKPGRLTLVSQLPRSNPEEVEDETSGTNSHLISSFWRRVLFAAWLAALLGIIFEGILLAVVSGMGESRSAKSAIAGIVQNVSWSTIVCVGLAIGTTASKLRAPLMGLLGLFSAPLAFVVARSAHQSAVQALSLASAAAGGPSPMVLALVKGVEYLVLGTILGWISRRPTVRAGAYMATGLIVGTIFGSTILAITYHAMSQTIRTTQLVSMGINELLFPFGCSLVLFTAGMMSKGAEAMPAATRKTSRRVQIGGPMLTKGKRERSAVTIG